MKRLDIPTPDGVIDTYLHTPDGGGSHPAVLFYMDAFAIRQDLHDMARRLAGYGYAVVLPNLYYRHGDFPPFDHHAVAQDGPERKRFKGMIQSITGTMVMRDTRAVIDALAREPAVAPGPMAAVGYCMGGGFALSAAGTFPDRVAAAAAFHGGSLATDKPDSPHLLAGRMTARVYVGVAGIDPSFPPEQRQRLERAFDEAGVEYTLEVYEGAKHGFAVDGHMVYDRDAAERHWTTLTAFLASALGTR